MFFGFFFFSLFIFHGHSTREPASSRLTYFILRAYTGTSDSQSQHRKKIGRGFGKKCRWMDWKGSSSSSSSSNDSNNNKIIIMMICNHCRRCHQYHYLIEIFNISSSYYYHYHYYVLNTWMGIEKSSVFQWCANSSRQQRWTAQWWNRNAATWSYWYTCTSVTTLTMLLAIDQLGARRTSYTSASQPQHVVLHDALQSVDRTFPYLRAMDGGRDIVHSPLEITTSQMRTK